MSPHSPGCPSSWSPEWVAGKDGGRSHVHTSPDAGMGFGNHIHSLATRARALPCPPESSPLSVLMTTTTWPWAHEISRRGACAGSNPLGLQATPIPERPSAEDGSFLPPFQIITVRTIPLLLTANRQSCWGQPCPKKVTSPKAHDTSRRKTLPPLQKGKARHMQKSHLPKLTGQVSGSTRIRTRAGLQQGPGTGPRVKGRPALKGPGWRKRGGNREPVCQARCQVSWALSAFTL